MYMTIMTTKKKMASGWIDTLTEQQSEELQALKRLIASEEEGGWKDDVAAHPDGDKWVLRFLRATMKDNSKREFDHKAAFERLKETMEWRREMGLNKPFEKIKVPEKWELFQEARPALRWVDRKAKTLVLAEKFGLMFSKINKKHMAEEDWIECLAYQSEKNLKMMREEFDVEPRGLCAILDFSGFGLGFYQRISFVKLMGSVASAHYPEAVQKVYIVRAPYIFAAAFAAVSKFLDKDTLSKISLTSGNPEALMKENFEEEKLPVEMGGTGEVKLPIPLDAR